MLYALFTYVITAACIITVTIATYILWLSTFWRRNGVPTYGNPISGVFTDTFLLKKTMAVCLKDFYFKDKSLKFYGTFVLGQPLLVLHDREIIKQVLLKDFSNFMNRGTHYDLKKDPLSGHLFNLGAEDWKFMRAKLSPTFTSGKIKSMFPVIKECVSTFHKAIDRERLSHNDVVDVRELLACLTTDIISSVAFGIEANAVGDVNSAFRKMGRAQFNIGFSRLISFYLRMNPTAMKFLSLRTAESPVNKFLVEAFSKTVEYREKNGVTRSDFMDLMIRLRQENNESSNGRMITMNDIAAQSFIFFIAGFETSSSTLGFFLYEVAKHPEIQRKVQEECDAVTKTHGFSMTYDALQTMEYTEKVLQETMRLYPTLPVILRAVAKTCKLPQTDVVLQKDTLVWVPTYALHMDDELFPEPLKFDPERFSKENKDKITPYSFMPFGEGPRTCIGMRFALVQMKAVVLELLSKYDVELSDETNLNLEFRPTNFLLLPTESIKLKITPRSKNES